MQGYSRKLQRAKKSNYFPIKIFFKLVELNIETILKMYNFNENSQHFLYNIS